MLRSFDGRFITIVANQPEVRPALGGEGEIDLCVAAAHPNNYLFMSDRFDGGIVLFPLYEGAYEAHTVAAKGSNARSVLIHIREVRDYMFRETLCETLLTKAPHAGAIWLTNHSGFQLGYERAGTRYMKMDLDTWAQACSTTAEQGRAFHASLEHAKRAIGSELPVHPEDIIHDRAVGAAVQMIVAGNVTKGVDYYNKWAIFSGYGQIKLLSEHPVLVDIQDALMGVRHGQVEILQCR